MSQAGLAGTFNMKGLTSGFQNNRFIANFLNSSNLLQASSINTNNIDPQLGSSGVFLPSVFVGTGIFNTIIAGTGIIQEAYVGTGVFNTIIAGTGLFDNLTFNSAVVPFPVSPVGLALGKYFC